MMYLLWGGDACQEKLLIIYHHCYLKCLNYIHMLQNIYTQSLMLDSTQILRHFNQF